MEEEENWTSRREFAHALRFVALASIMRTTMVSVCFVSRGLGKVRLCKALSLRMSWVKVWDVCFVFFGSRYSSVVGYQLGGSIRLNVQVGTCSISPKPFNFGNVTRASH